MALKSLLFLITFLVSNLVVNAQFKKGMRMVGSSVAGALYNSGTTDVSYPAPTNGFTSKTTSFNASLNPSMGWFITGTTVVGASLNINPAGNKTSFESGGTTFQRDKLTTFNLGGGGFARTYFGSSGFMPFGQAGFNLGITTLNTEGFLYASDIVGPYKSTYDGKSSGGFFVNAPIYFGLTKLLNPHTGFDIYAGYVFSYTKSTIKTTRNTDYGNNGSIELTSVSDETKKFTNHGFQVGVGFQVFLDPR